MAVIPGWVYVILGIVMILASQLIKDADGSKPMIIFLYVGIIFIVIGVGKYIYNSVFRKGKERKGTPHKNKLEPVVINTTQSQQQTHHARQHPHHRTARHHQQTHHQAQHPVDHMQEKHEVHRATHQQTHQTQHPTIIACPVCSTRHYSYADYCMRCGTKIK